MQAAAAVLVHVFAAAALILATRASMSTRLSRQVSAFERRSPDALLLPTLVFLAPTAAPGGGGGGGGNRQAAPIRRAQGVGHDAATLKTTRRPPTTGEGFIDRAPVVPDTIVLDARPLASGVLDQIGLPDAGVTSGTSTGPGSGGGVGTGSGTGVGPGRGPGFGPGSGGGTGGGVYRPGGSVTPPRLLVEVKPTYTDKALHEKIQGTVWLEAVVAPDGTTTDIRITRALDPGGLDEQAVAALRRWRFEPGRLAGAAVPVLVTVALDFEIR